MKKYIYSPVFLVFLIGAVALMSAQRPAISSTDGVNPADYPEISDKEMGQLRWILAIADQGLDDFTHLEGNDQYGMTAYRYSIAFMTYFLAVEQYHKLPKVIDVDFPKVVLKRAIYDEEKGALIVTTEPGGEPGGSTTLKIVNLDPRLNYILTMDGKNPKKIDGRDVLIDVPLDGRHNIVLMESH